MTQEEMAAEFGSSSAASNTCSIRNSKKKAGKEKETVAAIPGNTACLLPRDSSPPPPPPNVDFIYHLCQKSKWAEAKNQKQPYFPPTFMADGKFTRASVDRADMVEVANRFYKDVEGDYILLEISAEMLYGLGIAMLAQTAPESTPQQPVKCLQLFGGISTTLPGLVPRVYPMERTLSDGTFVRILDPVVVVPVATKTQSTKTNQSSTKTSKTSKKQSRGSTTNEKASGAVVQPIEAKQKSKLADVRSSRVEAPKPTGLFGRLRGTKQ